MNYLKAAYFQWTWLVLLATALTMALGIYIVYEGSHEKRRCGARRAIIAGIVISLVGFYFIIPAFVAVYYKLHA